MQHLYEKLALSRGESLANIDHATQLANVHTQSVLLLAGIYVIPPRPEAYIFVLLCMRGARRAVRSATSLVHSCTDSTTSSLGQTGQPFIPHRSIRLFEVIAVTIRFWLCCCFQAAKTLPNSRLCAPALPDSLLPGFELPGRYLARRSLHRDEQSSR